MSTWFAGLTGIAIIIYALLGGVFLAFSDFIMRALARTQTTGGIEAMQGINREVFRYVFMPLFLGMAPASLALLAYGFLALSGPGASLIAGAALAYLLGVFGVTVAFNVPLNNALEGMNHADGEAGVFWRTRYLPRWTLWNSVRTLCCLLASGALLAALLGAGIQPA